MLHSEYYLDSTFVIKNSLAYSGFYAANFDWARLSQTVHVVSKIMSRDVKIDRTN